MTTQTTNRVQKLSEAKRAVIERIRRQSMRVIDFDEEEEDEDEGYYGDSSNAGCWNNKWAF